MESKKQKSTVDKQKRKKKESKWTITETHQITKQERKKGTKEQRTYKTTKWQ